MKITFLGATETVTGSKYLLETERKKILIDCGLFQGLKDFRLRNWSPFPIAPRNIDAVILTHAHIDHSGYLPLLIKNGFAGQVLCTSATRDLCSILLPDSGYLQEEEARLANKYHYSKHTPAMPLYTKEDAEIALQSFQCVDFEKTYALDKDLTFRLSRSGHILGSSFIFVEQDGTSILFSGDIGRLIHPVMRPPVNMKGADYLVVESTYGDRIHDPGDPKDRIAEIINQTIKRGGSIIVPAFAVGRTQTLLYDIYRLKRANRIPDIPVYLDSPLAIDATKIFCQHKAEHQLSTKQCAEMSSTATYVATPEESKLLDKINKPIIIISASGMATGGRVLHHLKNFITDSKHTILFTGYQAAGTRGDRIVRKEKTIKIYGESHEIRAHVELLHNVSAHADSEEILKWLSAFTEKPYKVFITHGEPNAATALQSKISERLGWNTEIPHYLETVEL
jgi:metallo-beta-lactamase family protein